MSESQSSATPKAIKVTARMKAIAASEKEKKAARTHPPTSQMVTNAISSLNERGGSSLSAIKKFVATTYKVDIERYGLRIRKFLNESAETGILVRTKGTGANGSFKLPSEKKPAAKKSTDEPKKRGRKPKETAAKKDVAKPKRSTARNEKDGKPSATKAAKPAAKKSPTKKTKASVAKKSPKPKRVVKQPAKKATPKK